MIPYQNIKLQCVFCKADFIWTVGEQKFMDGLVADGKIQSVQQPKRCPACRQQKREQRAKFKRENDEDYGEFARSR